MNKTLLGEGKTAAIKPKSMEHTPKKSKSIQSNVAQKPAPLAARPIPSTNVFSNVAPGMSKPAGVKLQSKSSATVPPAANSNSSSSKSATVTSSKSPAKAPKNVGIENVPPKKKKAKKAAGTPLSPGTMDLLSQGLREGGNKKSKATNKR